MYIYIYMYRERERETFFHRHRHDTPPCPVRSHQKEFCSVPYGTAAPYDDADAVGMEGRWCPAERRTPAFSLAALQLATTSQREPQIETDSRALSCPKSPNAASRASVIGSNAYPYYI